MARFRRHMAMATALGSLICACAIETSGTGPEETGGPDGGALIPTNDAGRDVAPPSPPREAGPDGGCTPRPSDECLTVPEGFTVEAFAPNDRSAACPEAFGLARHE